jgi:hypothetical protein
MDSALRRARELDRFSLPYPVISMPLSQSAISPAAMIDPLLAEKRSRG